MTWTVGKPMTVGDRLFVDGVEITTGSATNTYWRDNAGVAEFLQADGASWSTTPHSFTCPYVANVGFANLTTNAPSSAESYTIHYEVTHSVYGIVASGENEVSFAATGNLSIALGP